MCESYARKESGSARSEQACSDMSHLFIATPIDQGHTAGFFTSILQCGLFLGRHDVKVTFFPLVGDSLVTRARMVLEAEFLKTDADALMFIDSDIRFDPRDVLRLYRSECDIIGGVYPLKTIPIEWPANFRGALPDPLSGLIEAQDVPAGFLRIKRHVIETMRAAYPELGCEIIAGLNGSALFDARIDEGSETRRYMSEDFAFCRLAQGCGFKVMVDPDITLTHTGLYDFTACLADAAYEYQIEGWMTPKELRWLEMTAATMGSVVEVGSWKGRSTNALLHGCKGTVYAVDHWKGSEAERSGPHAEAVTGDVFGQFMSNVGHYSNLEVVRGASVEVAAREGWLADGAQMVFIDGGHTYPEVKADIEAWRPKAKRVLCGHDYNDPEVRRAVDELLGPVENPAGSIWVKRIADPESTDAGAGVVEDEVDATI